MIAFCWASSFGVGAGVGSAGAAWTVGAVCKDSNSLKSARSIAQEKLELYPGTGVIPTFVFYVVLFSAMKRLLTIARGPECAFLSFNHRLSFR